MRSILLSSCFIGFLYSNAVDILFNVFCECAELNPEPCHGKYCFNVFFKKIFTFSWQTNDLNKLFCNLEEQEEANDWIFGPDQMGDDSMEAGFFYQYNFTLYEFWFCSC